MHGALLVTAHMTAKTFGLHFTAFFLSKHSAVFSLLDFCFLGGEQQNFRANKIFGFSRDRYAWRQFTVGRRDITQRKSLKQRSMTSLVQTSTMAVEGLKKRKRDGGSKSKKVSIQEPSQQLGASVIRISSVVQPQYSAPVVGMSTQAPMLGQLET